MNHTGDRDVMNEGGRGVGQKAAPAGVRAHAAVLMFGAGRGGGWGDGTPDEDFGIDLAGRGRRGVLDMDDVAVLEAGDVVRDQQVAERQDLDGQENLADQLQTARSCACDPACRHPRWFRRRGQACQAIDQNGHNGTKLLATGVDTPIAEHARAQTMTKTVSSAALSVVVRDAVIALVLSGAVGLVVNFARPHGIPFIQKTEYQILVPCPEGSGDAPAIAADAPEVREARTLRVDARAATDHAAWHPVGTINLPFDYLAPAPPAEVKKIASSGAARVVVFGDGNDPDSGEQLARELAGAGIRNIFFVAGGAPALQKAPTGRGAP